MKNKKALTSTFLITTIIIIVGFAVVLFAATNITNIFKGNVDKEACRDSVIARSINIPTLGINVGQSMFPLACKTENICLTMGGKCPTGYTKISVKNEEDIKENIAVAMKDCWWMLGEGKFNFLPSGDENCLICSDIAFDDKIKASYPSINGFNSYLYTATIPNSNGTYMEYITAKDSKSIEIPQTVDSISTNSNYIVLFMAARGTPKVLNLLRAATVIGAYWSIKEGLDLKECMTKKCYAVGLTAKDATSLSACGSIESIP